MFCTRLDEPGICPVCGMVMEEFVDTGALELDAETRQSISLRSEFVERRHLARELSTIGAFEADETRVKTVSAWVDGRIERLYADFTGVPVKEGWHLFDLYSPQLYSAQQELLVAKRAARREGLSESAQRDANRLLDIAREKLRLLGLTPAQVALLEESDEPSLTLTIPSPDDGIVIEKKAEVGMYVKQGDPVFRVADLSTLWLIAEIHERDLGWVALGQDVQVRVNAFPGRDFIGRVGFIDPVLDQRTRTVRVRVEVPNPDGVLKPGMFGEASIFAELASDATLAAPGLIGDYACPMHPLQRAHTHGEDCPICGMDMVETPAHEGRPAGRVWAVPREAVLSTGRRHLVYIEYWADPDWDPMDGPRPELTVPRYQGFEVELGPLAAEYRVRDDGTRRKVREYYPLRVVVLPSGEEEVVLPTGVRTADGELGWRIVTKGQFLIDSQMELTGRPSLMRPEGGEAADPHAGH
jgi:membrane fusion protein, copper/silver efflux system